MFDQRQWNNTVIELNFINQSNPVNNSNLDVNDWCREIDIGYFIWNNRPLLLS